MIEGINISKSFGKHVIFSDLNFFIDTGEFVCFSGESGAGKTTLLNIIGHIEPIDSGTVLIDGNTYVRNKEKINLYKNKIGFLFQNFALIEEKTVKENLKIVRKNDRTDCSILEALDKVGLAGKINHKVYTLSGGEQQRVALARLYIKQCDIVLADEPTGSLDRKNADNVMNILSNLNEQGKTIVLVTHDENVRRRAQREIIL